jgi:hypothetical protein
MAAWASMRVVAAVVAALGLSGAPALPQAGASTAPGATAARSADQGSTEVSVVTLITGDQVAVTPRPDGEVKPTILRGSPHAQGSVVRFATPQGSFLIPRLPIREQAKLDSSLFNLTELAALPGSRVPIEVTFAGTATPHAIRGLTLDLADPVHLKTGATRVAASYPGSFSGLSASDLAGVARISLPTAHQTAPPATLPLHTLTIHLSTAGGHPVYYAVGYIINLDNSRRYLQTPDIRHGLLKIQVPEGHYGVIAWTFTGVVVEAPEISVTRDRSVSLNVGNATVRPAVSVPSFDGVETNLSVGRLPEKGFGFPLSFEFIGVPLRMRLQPASGEVQYGTFTSGISGTFVPHGEASDPVPSSLAVTGDVRRGIPSAFRFTHPKSDFAVVQQRFHANGPAGVRMSGLSAAARGVDFFSIQQYGVQVPSRRTVFLQASRSVGYDQAFYPVQTPHNDDFSLQISRFSRYLEAGPAPAVAFLHGPVGPGIEARGQLAGWGRYCALCRVKNELNGGLPLFDGAGSAMFSYIGKKDGGWSLWHDGTRIRSGFNQITPHVALPPAWQPYTLTATSHPTSGLWTLSTNVKDAWTFRSGYSHQVIPILLARYLPKIALDGSMAAGPTGFRLDFANLGKSEHPVVRASVSLSTDGGNTWRPAHLSRLDDNSFHVQYMNPAAHGPVQYMSLRVTGTDSGGRSVTETALRVYRLRP